MRSEPGEGGGGGMTGSQMGMERWMDGGRLWVGTGGKRGTKKEAWGD